jgi:hypothetical protein
MFIQVNGMQKDRQNGPTDGRTNKQTHRHTCKQANMIPIPTTSTEDQTN